MGSAPPVPVKSDRHVIVVGGGLSGLAASVELVSGGIPVTLLEQKSVLGGRAYSFRDATTGDIVDNGQHVLIAGYKRTLHFLEVIGTRKLLTVQARPSLVFHHPQRGFQQLDLPFLPSPFHIVAGLLRCRLFSLRDRLRILAACISIGRSGSEELGDALTVDGWLNVHGQTEECKRSFWEPLAVSIMNERIDRAAAQPFLNSLRHAFLGHRNNAALAVPSVGLSDLYVNAAREYIVARGGVVRCGSDVMRMMHHENIVRGVELRNGEQVTGSAVILAVPHYRLSSLLDGTLADVAKLDDLQALPSTPIVSVHLWFDADFMAHSHIGLIGRRVQWIFNRRRICNERGKGGHVSALISAADEFVSLSNQELVQLAIEDLQSVYPHFQEHPIHAVVVREKRATFSSTPATELLRPSQATRISNLFLAGDWTETGFPATIEGALISAERCAVLTRAWLNR